ncbi:MAG: hypothetical protein D6808_05955 [Candidatus Dadabacteria bacterium]|nr:MAG: hypothetical protein D6808_05955 [Candidatus Dadabacteria bacterium]
MYLSPPPKRYLYWHALGYVFFLGLILLAFLYPPYRFFSKSYFLSNYKKNLLKNTDALKRAIRALPAYYGSEIFSDPRVPSVNLSIKFKHIQKFAREVQTARKLGTLPPSSKRFVSGRLEANGKSYRIKVRLKGDLLDHFRGKRWSFRVKILGGEALWGMRKFSLQAPYTRDYQIEPLYHKIFREEGLIAPRYKFVQLSLNGDPIGLTTLEEGFSKELIEYHKRREGVILKLDETLFWEAWHRLAQKHAVFDNWRSATITYYNKTKVETKPTIKQQTQQALGMLRAVAEKIEKPSDIFDRELWGKYFALCEIFGAEHMSTWNNLRFYFNPLTAKIEPVVFDANHSLTFRKRKLVCQGGTRDFSDTLLADSAIKKSFFKWLGFYSHKFQEPDVQKKMKKMESSLLSIVRREFPWVQNFTYGYFSNHLKFLANISQDNASSFIAPRPQREAKIYRDDRYPAIALGYRIHDKGKTYIEFHNLLFRPIRIEKIKVILPAQGKKSETILDVIPLNLTIKSSAWGEPPSKVILPFDLEKYPPSALYKAEAKIAKQKTKDPFIVNIVEYYPPAKSPLAVETDISELEALPFVRRYNENTYKTVPGSWSINDIVIIPQGYALEIVAGTTINFGENGGILAIGDLNIHGSETSPVTLTAKDKGARWRGIYVLAPSRPLKWQNASISSLTSFSFNGLNLTGAITIRKGDVTLKNITISDVNSEDALNIVHSNISISNLRILHTPSDAFDCDYCSGKLLQSSFSDISGDGFDISGSSIVASNLAFQDIKDKAISVGEKSTFRGEDINIKRSSVGVASKDRSVVSLKSTDLSDIRYAGFMAYCKKKEFGGSELSALRTKLDNVSELAIAQTGSLISIDGKKIEERELDITQLYSQGFMKK